MTNKLVITRVVGKNMCFRKAPQPTSVECQQEGLKTCFHCGFPLAGGRINSMASSLNVLAGFRKNTVLDPYNVDPLISSLTLLTNGTKGSW